MSNTRNQSRGTNSHTASNSRLEKAKEFIKDKIIEIIVGFMVAIIGWTVHDLPESINDLETRVASLEAKIEIIEGNYATLNSQIWSINRVGLNYGKTLESEPAPENEPEILVASADFSLSMISAQAPTKEGDDNVLANLEIIKDEEEIGIKIQNNENTTKKSMENVPFIMQYNENGEDVFFYGKYNEYGQWDGACIINRYKDSKLSSVMEAFYDNGTLISYRQIFKGINYHGQEIWYVSDRNVNGLENSGETTTYFFYGDCIQNFDINTVKKEDIMSVDKFLETIPSTIEGYYNGYTSNGRYNDDSGKAYLVKYKPDGNVRLLYVGKIKDGFPHDDTGEAWELSWGYANDGYHYHKGNFSEGAPQNTNKDWLEPKTQEFIDSKVNPADFNCPLTGLVSKEN